MRKRDLHIGERYAVLTADAAVRRDGSAHPADITCYEVVDVAAPIPLKDERVPRSTTRWHPREQLEHPDPDMRVRGIMVRGVDRSGQLSETRKWYDSAKLFHTTWDTWCDQQASRSAGKLARHLREHGGRVDIGYSDCVRYTAHSRYEPVTPARIYTLVAVDVERDGRDVLGRSPTNPDTLGAVVELGDGTQLWVADRHHLVVDPDHHNQKLDADRLREQRKAELRSMCEQHTTELKLDTALEHRHGGGNGDAALFTYKPGWDGTTIELDLETYLTVLTADDDTRARIAGHVARIVADQNRGQL